MRRGFHTYPISQSGVPDLLAWKPGTSFLRLLELKSPGAAITGAQAKFRENYDGPPVLTASSPIEAVRQVLDAFSGHNNSAWGDAWKLGSIPEVE
jgi:hypothetical protein